MKNTHLGTRLYILLRMIVALLVALIVGGLVFYAAGFNPLQAYKLIFIGAFGSKNAILTSINYAYPLLFTGLAFCLARNANLISMGAEGQLYAGAMTAALIAGYLPALPKVIFIPLILLASAVVAGLFGALVGYLKVKYDASEVILTLMFNYILTFFCTYLTTYPFRDVEQGLARTARIADEARFGPLFAGHFLTSAAILAIIAVVIISLVIRFTRYGYHIRIVGDNRLAADTAGIHSGKVIISVMFLSAAIAGLCGATQVMGVQYRFINNMSTGFGFEGVAVAALAGYNPPALLISGLLWGGLKAGAAEVNRVAAIPLDIILVIQAIVVVFMSAPRLLDLLLRPIKNGLLRNAKEA